MGCYASRPEIPQAPPLPKNRKLSIIVEDKEHKSKPKVNQNKTKVTEIQTENSVNSQSSVSMNELTQSPLFQRRRALTK
jgi:hypothetical protein